ncbi:MAG: hypothetical protein PHV59_03095 [Victivallales bacterium]|nr:hypothetical protein [Victivallales bacterium]
MSFLKKGVKNSKTVFCGMTAIVIVTIFCGMLAVNYRNEIWPTENILFDQKRIYGRLRADLQKAQEQHDKYTEEEEKVLEKLKTFYHTDAKDNTDMYFRQRIEHAAKFSTLILKSMSSIRRKKIKDETFSLEISISVEGDFEKIICFLQELDKKNEAEVYWVSCYIRPTGKKGENSVNVSGVLRLFCTDGKLLKENSGREKNKRQTTG